MTTRRFPWAEVLEAVAGLVSLAVVLLVALGRIDDPVANVVVTAVGAAIVLVLAVRALVAWRSWRATPPAAIDLAGDARAGLIDKVRDRWIGTRDQRGHLDLPGKLAQDLALGVYIEVRLDPALGDAPASPVDLAQAWRRSGRALVLLGPPGGGKSVQLLLLAELLLDRAVEDPHAGVPVVVGLPS
jgi:hypothetical protein